VTIIKYYRVWLVAMICLIGFAPIVQAQTDQSSTETEEEEPLTYEKPVPIAVAMVSGVDRGFAELEYIFEAIEHPELLDLFSASLANVRDLKGIDRTRPVGVMIFLKPGLFPQPAFAGFIPCDDFDEFLETMGSTAMKPAKVPEMEGRYSMQGPGQAFYFELIGEDVLLTNDEFMLDNELPDPATLTKTLSTRYDAAAQLNISSVPVGMRNVLLDFLRASMEAQMQQRDEEPEGQWRVRKASIANNLRFLEQLALQGDSLTVGLDVSKELRKAVIEVDLNARPGSDFAKYLSDSGGVTSYFRVLQDDPAILSAYMSWQLQKEDAKNFKEMAIGIRQIIEHQREQALENPDAPAEQKTVYEDNPVRLEGLFDCLADTAEAGILDGFFRFQGSEPGETVILAAVRVVNGARAAQTIGDLIQLANAQDSDNTEIQLNYDTYQGVTFHRIQPTRKPAGMERTFGENVAFHFGAGERTLWFVMGGDKAMPAAHDAIDQILDPGSQPIVSNTAPFRFTLNMSQWMSLWDDPERERQGFRKQAAETFEQGADRIIADMTPKDNGVRYRIRFEEGFVKLIGIALARAWDFPLDE
jgi:hypothetical protein